MKTELRHPDLEELLGAYALDAVDDAERDVVDQHLPTCARCRAEVEEHREVAALLAHSGTAAPEGLWNRIADSLEGEPPELVLTSVAPFRAPGPIPTVGRSWRTRATAVVMAVAAAVIVVLGVQIKDQDQRLDGMASLLSVDALERAFQAAEATPGSEVVQVESFDGLHDAQAVVTEEGLGYLQASGLPRLPEGRTYQLWGDTGDQRVSLGLLGADPAVVPFEVPEQFVGVAITDEAEPGVIVSDQPVLSLGLLPR
ncbi:MAG: anti-sigma factor domain-containing protein [Acidimicrobiales bacterium]